MPDPKYKYTSTNRLIGPMFSNNQVQDNTNLKKSLSPNEPGMIKANAIKEARRLAYIKAAEEEARNIDRSGYASGFKSTHEQDVQTAKDLANKRFNYNEQPWQDKAKSIAIDAGLGLIPEIATLRKLPFTKSIINEEKILQKNPIVYTSSNNSGINNNRIWMKGNKSIEGWDDIRPVYKDDGYELVQNRYIDNHNDYMNSPLFEKKMKEFYPDVNIDEYRKAVNHNLKREYLTYKPASEYPTGEKNIGGWYIPRDNMPNGSYIMSGAKTTFNQRINLSNEEMLKPTWFRMENAGKSFSTNLGNSIEHELGHQRTNAKWLLPDDLTQDELLKNVRQDIPISKIMEKERSLTNYYSEPTEFDTRILSLKNNLKENKIVDFHKEPITEEHINKFLNPNIPDSKLKDVDEYQSLLFEELAQPKFKKGFDLRTEQGKVLKEEYDKLWNEVYASEKIKKPYTMNSDTKDLLEFWDPKYIAKMANKLPITIGASIGVGTTAKQIYNGKSR